MSFRRDVLSWTWMRYILFLWLALIPINVSGAASDRRDADEDDWTWTDPALACSASVTVGAIRQVLDTAPGLTVGFEHRAALRLLRNAAADLPCLLEPIDQKVLTDLWYQVAMASLYVWDEVGAHQDAELTEIVRIFKKVRQLDPGYEWDTREFGTFGQDLWRIAIEDTTPPDRIVVRVPRARPGALWLDGRTVTPDTRKLELPPGTYLVQYVEGTILSGRWWVITPDTPSTTLPLSEEAGKNPRSERRLHGSLELGGWALPLLYLGPALDAHWRTRGSLELSLGAAAAWTVDGLASYWLVPIRAGLWWRVPAGSTGIAWGLGYQGYIGAGFAKPPPPDTSGAASTDTSWSWDPTAGWQLEGAPVMAHGAVGQILVSRRLGGIRVGARAAAGVVVWPSVMVAPQGYLGIRLERAARRAGTGNRR